MSIDQARADEYLAFAHTRSLPMFRAQAGFNGVMFARREGERAVITFWRDISAVDALSRSESYQATVSEIEGKGFTQGDAFIELFEIEGAFVDPLLTDGC